MISEHHCFRRPVMDGLNVSSVCAVFGPQDNIPPLALRPHNIIDSMLVHSLEKHSGLYCWRDWYCSHLPRELLVRHMPLEHLPVHQGARENIDFVVVLGMRMPKFGRLPVNGAH